MTDFPDGPELALPQGDVTEGVVRVGDTVRRPHQCTSQFVAAYLQHLAEADFDGAPRFLGRDSRGRDVLSFVAGTVPGDPVEPWAAADGVLAGVGRLLRRLHDATDGWSPPVEAPVVAGRPPPAMPAEPRLVSHRDVTPQNVVFRHGAAFGLIDFDLANWTTRSIDLANTAMHWVPMRDPRDWDRTYTGVDLARRVRLLLDGYGADRVPTEQFLDACAMRFGGLHTAMKWNADHLGGGWARMWADGVGEVILRRVAWFDGIRAELRRRLANGAG